MSHVDDGILHAYLDGGLSALDVVRVERHIADCGACQIRLDKARGLIQRAARLLDWASPPAGRAAPPLAELQPVVAPRWRAPVAWAATIVIALGAGIYGGQRLLTSGENDGIAALTEPKAAAPAEERRAAPITVTADAESSATPRDLAAKAAPQPPPAATPAPEAGAGIAQRDSLALNRVAEAPVTLARTDTAAVRAKLDTNAALALGARRETPSSITQSFAPTPPAAAAAPNDSAARARRAASEPIVTGAAAAPGPDQRLSRAATWTQIGADSARILLGTAAVSLPDLPVTAIRTLNGVVAVDQVVPPGRVIRLLQRRASTDEAETGTPSDLLARYVDGVRVEISGPMPADSLSRLLERARAMP